MEFLNLLCGLYIVGLTVVLPLYTGGTYSQLGDTKYLLFRNLTGLCLCLWLLGTVFEGVRRLQAEAVSGGGPERRAAGTSREVSPGRAGKVKGRLSALGVRGFSALDVFVLSYGGAVVLSAFLSSYRQTAWLGYMEWYMGGVSQLMFVGIYFFVSRCYDGKGYPLALGTAAFFAAAVLGILHRLGLDPLGLMRDFNTGDWTYSHMLSTLGNINWFCGYCSVAVAFPVAGFLKNQKRWVRWLLYPVSVCGLLLLFIQGSDTGVMLTAICLLVCLFCGRKEEAVFERTLFLAAGLFFLIPCYGGLASLLGKSALAALPADSIGWNAINHKLWWAAAAAAMGLCFLLRLLARKRQKRAQGYVRYAFAGLPLLAVAVGAAVFLVRQPAGEMWGSGRGALWKIALEGFSRGGWIQKLVGTGPDCFAEYIYSSFSADALFFQEGRWAGSVYANAHNEWLNHLVNLGIMGTGCYMGIFVSGAIRCRRYLPGILALALYGAASLTGFQQCLSTPLLFLVLGLCENRMRRAESPQTGKECREGQEGRNEYEMGEIQDQDNYGGGRYHNQHIV